MSQSDFDSEPDESPDRAGILILSFVTFLIGSGVALGGFWLTEISPAELMSISSGSVVAGILISLPMCVVLAFFRYSPFQWTRRLWDAPVRILGAGLTDLNALDVASVATMAGVGEELLFRGFLQSWIGSYGTLWGLLVPNLLFGLLHAMTPAYAAGAFLVGLSFSCILHFSNEDDLTSLMVAHAMYDFIAWQWLAHGVRSNPD